MRVISRRRLRLFWESPGRADATDLLKACLLMESNNLTPGGIGAAGRHLGFDHFGCSQWGSIADARTGSDAGFVLSRCAWRVFARFLKAGIRKKIAALHDELALFECSAEARQPVSN